MRIYYSKDFNDSYELFIRVMSDFEGLDPGLRIMRTRKGKPYLPDHPQVYFSISHTRGIWMCAVDHLPVGLDCELIDRVIRNPVRLAERFFADDETGLLKAATRQELYKAEKPEGLPPPSPAGSNRLVNALFLFIWTRKEAAIKLTGRGMFGGLDKFSVCAGLQEYAVEAAREDHMALVEYISEGICSIVSGVPAEDSASGGSVDCNMLTFGKEKAIISLCTEEENGTEMKDIDFISI